MLSTLPLTPVHFFALEFCCPRALTPLPDTSHLCHDEPFAQVAFGWSEQGITIAVRSDVLPTRSVWPEFREADAFELFFDTRNNKSAGSLTRYCHQFLFLPYAVEGMQVCECTRLPSRELRPLCDPEALHLEATQGKDVYEMRLEIPSHALHGFDPQEFRALGFSYCLHRSGGRAEHLSIHSKEYSALDQHPDLWATLHLVD